MNVPLPDAARLQQMTARFAPSPIGVDISKLPAGERQALAKLVEAARLFDSLFLRQAWSGNEALLLQLLDDQTPLGRARLHYFMINKGPWSRLDHNAAFLPGVPPQAGGGELLPGGSDQGGGRRLDQVAAGGRAGRRPRLLHHHPAPPRREPHRRPLQPRVPGRAGARGRAAPGGRRRHAAADPEGLPHQARRRLRVQRLLRVATWPGWSWTRRSSRPSAPTRSTRTSGSTSRPPSRPSSPCATTPRRPSSRASAASCRTSRTTCPSIPRCATRSSALWPRSAWSTSSSRPATPTAACRPRPSTCPTTSAWCRRRASKRVMLKNMQEAKFNKVLLPIARVALPLPTARTSPSTPSSPTSSCTS